MARTLAEEVGMSIEAVLREIQGTVAERVFLWLAQTDEYPAPPRVADVLGLQALDAAKACHRLEDLGLVDFDGSLAARVRVSLDGREAAKRLLADRTSGKNRRAALRTAMLNWLSDSEPTRVDSMPDFAHTPGATLHGTTFTDQEIVNETTFLSEQGLIEGIKAWGGPLMRPSLTAHGRDCVDRFNSDVNAWLSSRDRGSFTHNQTTISDSPGAQSMSGSPGGQQTATVTVTADNRRQLLQFADQIADQIVGLPAKVAPDTKAGVEELRQAATDDHADEGWVRAALGTIAVSVATAVGTDAGLKIMHLVGQAVQSLGG
jgi:hypothetical protein